MSITENAIEKFARTKTAISEHITANKSVFDEHERLVGANIDARNDVEDAATQEAAGKVDGDTFEAAGYKVVVTPQTQTFGDVEAIDALIANGSINAEFRAALVKTNQRPPRITITEAN